MYAPSLTPACALIKTKSLVKMLDYSVFTLALCACFQRDRASSRFLSVTALGFFILENKLCGHFKFFSALNLRR